MDRPEETLYKRVGKLNTERQVVWSKQQEREYTSVSYTHLDVYKRQCVPWRPESEKLSNKSVVRCVVIRGAKS